MPFQEPAYEHGDEASVFLQCEVACVQQLELFGGKAVGSPMNRDLRPVLYGAATGWFLAFFIVYQATCKYHIPARP